MTFEPQNILLINFGQIGDVILSLPAMRALRERFADSKLTFFVGTSAKAIAEMSGLADEIIAVDRVELRDSNPFWSVKEIIKLALSVRKKRFDFVVDLHSLPETNLLGYFSGAKTRLFVNRGTRSLNFLSNFRPKPPDEVLHLPVSEYYAKSLEPLDVKGADIPFWIVPAASDMASVEKIFDSLKIGARKIIGIKFGTGSSSRRTSLESLGKLARKIEETGEYGVVVFFGPEEAGRREEFYECFSESVPLLDTLSLQELAAAFSRMEAVIGNDSGPIHLAGALGVPIVVITGENGLVNFTPPAKKISVVTNADIYEPDTDRAFDALISLIK